jgi:hypothetical protein
VRRWRIFALLCDVLMLLPEQSLIFLFPAANQYLNILLLPSGGRINIKNNHDFYFAIDIFEIVGNSIFGTILNRIIFKIPIAK